MAISIAGCDSSAEMDAVRFELCPCDERSSDKLTDVKGEAYLFNDSIKPLNFQRLFFLLLSQQKINFAVSF